ncbi:MAG: methylated-DNA--[protein]-cysteine S-methyltransferase [Paracoccaceae bacterium]
MVAREIGYSSGMEQQSPFITNGAELLQARFFVPRGAAHGHKASPPADSAGLAISHGWFDSPFGRVLAMGSEHGLCGLAFADECGDAAALADMRGRWPSADFIAANDTLAQWVKAAFDGGTPPLHLIGTDLQQRVWAALYEIPPGHVTTYSALAAAAGNPRAVRAVASAVGRNPISWLIPCHRALRKTGGLGGYHWGLSVKRAMLAHEAARILAQDAA